MREKLVPFLIVSLAALSAEGAEPKRAIKVPAPHTQIVDGSRTIEVVDLCPQFLDFYQAAKGADPATRWKLWGEKYRFTYGQGTTGMIREAYAAGWIVIGDLLQQGKTFPELARIRSADMPAITRDAIAHWLAKKSKSELPGSL